MNDYWVYTELTNDILLGKLQEVKEVTAKPITFSVTVGHTQGHRFMLRNYKSLFYNN